MAALALQCYGLYAPAGPPGPSLFSGADKVAHALLFGLPALIALWARRLPGPVLGVLVVHAPVSELVQHWLLSQRSGDPLDVLADLSGVLLGAILGAVLRRSRTGDEETRAEPLT